MAYTKKTWLGRQGTGLNKFSINGATPVTVVNQPDAVTQEGDALSAGNMNNLEERIEAGFNETADLQQVENLQKIISQHDARISNIEQKDGDYTIVTMSDGDAVPTGKADYALVKALRGVGRIANNLMPDAKQSDSRSFSSSTSDYNQVMATFSANEVSVVAGHVYLASAKITRTIAQNNAIALVGFCSNGSNIRLPLDNGSANGVVSVLYSPSASGYLTDLALNNYYGKQGYDSGDLIAYADCILTDLTVYFNGNIPTNAQTIAQIQQNYPELLEPSEYNTGSVVFPTYTAVKSNHNNKWNQHWENGIYDSNGGAAPSANNIRSKNDEPIPCKPSTAYYFFSGDGANLGREVFFYTYNDVFISYQTLSANGTFTTPDTAYKMRFDMYSTYGGTYKDDITIAEGSTAITELIPFGTIDTLTLPTPVTPKGAGSVAEEYYPETGRITHPIGQYTLSENNTWYFYPSPDNRFFFQGLSDVIKKIPVTELGNVLLEGFTPKTAAIQYAQHNEYSVATDNNGRVFVYVASWVGKTPAEVASLMAGKTITFELATPDPDTYIDPVPDNFIRTEGGGSISTEQTQTPQIDGKVNMGFFSL